jgi:hypothetical protein
MAHPPQELIMELTTATPVEIDTEIAKLSVPLHRAQVTLAWLESKDFRNRRNGTDEQIAAQQVKIDEALDAIAPFDAEYRRRGGWSRFFLVTNNNGHIHSSQSCSTCYWSTQFAWLPALSGKTEAEAVEDQGEILCSVCFPSAPVEWTNGTSKASKEEKAQRAAEKAERDAKKAAKAINQPDGSVLREPGSSYPIKTVVSAWRYLVDDIFTSRFYGYQGHPEWREIAVASLAAKLGETEAEIRAQVEKKVQAKAKREGV